MFTAAKKAYHKFIKYKHGINYEYRVSDYKVYVDNFTGKEGLEVGGPSSIFEYFGAVPLYPHLKGLDNINFSGNTVWEGSIDGGKTFRYDEKKKLGYQYIGEAADLSGIPDKKYDFLISSNCLEHLANPIRAINEWLRVIKSNGVLLIIVPHKDATFDHQRPVTTLEHLLDDFEKNTSEGDMTHLEEILSLHDLALDTPAGSFEEFSNRCRKNIDNRCMHHHVYSASLLSEIFHRLDRQVLDIDILVNGNIVMLVRNQPVLVPDTQILRNALLKSPYKTDRDDLHNRMLGK